MTNLSLPNLSAAQRAEIRDALTQPGARSSYPTSGSGWNDRVSGLLERLNAGAATDKDRMEASEARYAFAVLTGATIRGGLAARTTVPPDNAALAGVQAMAYSASLLQSQLQALAVHLCLRDASKALDTAASPPGASAATMDILAGIQRVTTSNEQLLAANERLSQALAETLAMQRSANAARSALEERLKASRAMIDKVLNREL